MNLKGCSNNIITLWNAYLYSATYIIPYAVTRFSRSSKKTSLIAFLRIPKRDKFFHYSLYQLSWQFLCCLRQNFYIRYVQIPIWQMQFIMELWKSCKVDDKEHCVFPKLAFYSPEWSFPSNFIDIAIIALHLTSCCLKL